MKAILYKFTSLFSVIKSFFVSVKSFFTYSHEYAVRHIINTVKATSYLYVGYMAMSYAATDIDYVLKQTPVTFVQFTFTDYLWFISVKTLAFSFYYVMWLLSKRLPLLLEKAKIKFNEEKLELFKYEMFAVFIFSVADLIWQVTEMINYWWANNGWMQAFISIFSAGAFGFLVASRAIIKLLSKDNIE